MQEEVGVGPGLLVEGGVGRPDTLGHVVVQTLGLIGDVQTREVIHDLGGTNSFQANQVLGMVLHLTGQPNLKLKLD